MEVRTSKIGWCVGIERAYNLMNKQAARAVGKPIYATHDAQPPNTNADMDTLRRIERGDERLLERYPALKAVQVLYDPSVLQGDETLLLGFHGLPRDTIEDLTERGIEVKDYKCPFIARLDNTVDRLVAEGFDILIMGKRQNHHSRYAQEAATRHQRQCIVIETLEDVETIPLETTSRWALVGQVTGNTLLWRAVVERLEQRGVAAQVLQTICSDSYQRQGNAMELARQADCCLVVDDGGGASQSLFEVLSAVHAKVYRCRWRDDGSWKVSIDVGWLTGAGRVAVVGGILVPKWAIDEVAAYVGGLA
jgi:4-hydroxy-3-methylbut-2-en-1-yl diphosphate reductase